MKATIVIALALQAASVLAVPVTNTVAQLDKDSIIIKSSGGYKREAPALEKDSIIIKSAGTYKRDAAALDKDSIIIKSATTYKRGEEGKREPADVS